MRHHDRSPNPYQPPQVGTPPWFHWNRVPYGLYCGCRGYVEQMRKDGGTAAGHLICWVILLLFALLVGFVLWQTIAAVLAVYLRR